MVGVAFDAKVMKSGAAFGQNLSDRRLLADGFKQFDAAFADRQHGASHALIIHNLDFFQFEAERVAPERERVIDRFYGDAQVLNGDLFRIRHILNVIQFGSCRQSLRLSSTDRGSARRPAPRALATAPAPAPHRARAAAGGRATIRRCGFGTRWRAFPARSYARGESRRNFRRPPRTRLCLCSEWRRCGRWEASSRPLRVARPSDQKFQAK